MITANQHLPIDKMVDLVENLLPASESAQALTHVSACHSCAAQMATLERTIMLMRTDTAEDAPPDVLARAVGMFRIRTAAKNTAAAAEPSGLRRILAALRFDSLQLSPAFSVRAAQPTTGRQLLFSAGESDLDLRIAPNGRSWIVSGQVLGYCAGGQVELQGATNAVQTLLNDLCEFTLPPVPPGSYTLRLRLGDSEVEVPSLEIGS